MAEFRVEAVADMRTRTLCARVAQRFGVPRRYGSIRELATDPSVEAVAGCVPAAVRSEAALAAMDAGKHLFVEKPLALSLDEADRLLERERESRLMATVGFNLRWDRLVRSARELLRAGAIGTVSSVASAFEDARPDSPGPPVGACGAFTEAGPWSTRRSIAWISGASSWTTRSRRSPRSPGPERRRTRRS